MHKIPLYSKTPLYTGFPKTYTKAKGMYIWSNGNKHLDMAQFLGTHMLGYADKYINHHVKKCIDKSNTSLLNHKYMQKFSDLMLAIHPWADSIRLGNSGGEMMKLAYDLALEKITHTKNPKILFAGYFGWQLKNIEKQNKEILNLGVDGLNKINDYDYKPDVIFFELARHDYPTVETIEKLKKLQSQGTILALDEITSGFKFNYGGLHLLYDLIPDLCVFSKSIGNGYPISCVIGKEEYVESDLWISSTNWCDGIGFVAGYYTLKKFKHCNYRLLTKLGQSVQKIWLACALKHGVEIKVNEVPNIACFKFKEKHLECKSLYIQEMLKEGILASDQYYPSFAHKADHIKIFAKACDKVFKKIKKHLTGEEKYGINMLEVLDK